MNHVRLNGEIVSDIRMKTNTKKQVPVAEFLLAAPFDHPCLHTPEKYRAWLRICAQGEDAEWVLDTMYEGAYFELREGFVRTAWYKKSGSNNIYTIVASDIDYERCGDEPDDREPRNVGRFSGTCRGQWLSTELPDGTKKIGINLAADPDTAIYGSTYRSFLSVFAYGELADKWDGKIAYDDPVGFVEGSLQAFKGSNKVWGLFVNATDLRI